MMELSSLLQDLHLSSSGKLLPSREVPPITELLPRLREKLIAAANKQSESRALIGQLEQLFLTADPDWLFPPIRTNEWVGLKAEYAHLIRALIGCAALPLCSNDCSSLSPAAYQSVPSQATAVCSALTALLQNYGKGGGVKGPAAQLLHTLAPPIYVFAVTHFQEQAWTSSSSRDGAQRLQTVLLKVGGWKDSAHLLVGSKEEEHEGILTGVLDILQPQMSKDSWQRCEAVKLVFSWTLLQVTRPSLSPHLHRLLPPSLLLNDDYRPENCMLGVRCLHHIVLHTAAADLRHFNQAEVVYQAVFQHLYTNQAAVIQLSLSCLLDLLLVLEKPPSSPDPSSSRRKPCRHDDVLRLILTHMEVEHKMALRRVYASALPLYIDRMGVAVCRHLKRLERVLLGYLEISDSPEETNRLKILDVLQKTIKAAWPRMEARSHALLLCLLRLLVDVSSDRQLGESVRRELMDQTATSLRLLDACSHGRVQLLLQQVDSSCCSSDVLGCLAAAMEK
ncbi:TELO2-interacting protein 2 isoform X1 [Oryzias melastigma]|uniref:TELO2 interacting protein 2 n=2 Tax=Oryzias melastigma TaxID=30732 RepID=A0A3B3BNH3_ORYME|nr:TELO2-interacting protein 2 isoform X1 [Oryzias melastigma]